jgi:hypothetical protein
MKDKICLICHTTINTDDEYCEFKHYKRKEEIKSKAYYHINCFRRRLQGPDNANKLMEETMSLVKAAKEKMGIEDKQEVIM